MKRLINLTRNEEGVSALEYGLIAALIAAVIVGAVTSIGTSVNAAFQKVAAALTPAG